MHSLFYNLKEMNIEIGRKKFAISILLESKSSKKTPFLRNSSSKKRNYKVNYEIITIK